MGSNLGCSFRASLKITNSFPKLVTPCHCTKLKINDYNKHSIKRVLIYKLRNLSKVQDLEIFASCQSKKKQKYKIKE